MAENIISFDRAKNHKERFQAETEEVDNYINAINQISLEVLTVAERDGFSVKQVLSDLLYLTIGADICTTFKEEMGEDPHE